MPIGLPGGYEVATKELHTGREIRVIGFYPRMRRQLKRARAVAEMLRAAGLSGYVIEVKE